MQDTPPVASMNEAMAALRQAGAARWDAVGMRYLEALDKRLNTLQGDVHKIVQQKFSLALTAFSARFVQAQAMAQAEMAIVLAQRPEFTKELQRLYVAGHFRRLRQRIAQLRPPAEGDSLRHLVQTLKASPGDAAGSSVPAQPQTRRAPLRALRQSLSKLSVDKQVSQALRQAPQNAGPINSHMLMLRSLELMRELSPAYLEHFMTYADTLLGLEHNSMKKPPASKPRKAST